jgi:CheY-specific phosphatase CheX
MSSASLRRTPDALEHHDSVREALVEVAENSFFAFVDPVEAEVAAELLAIAPRWIQATVAFEGAFGGSMEIALAEPLAIELFVSFLGLEPGEVPDDTRLFDLVGEFCNMVCGSWLTRSCQRRSFDLRHPEVVRLPVAEGPEAASDRLVLTLNGQPACLRLIFSEA